LEERKFRAKLTRIQGEKVDLKIEADTQAIVADLEGRATRRRGQESERQASPSRLYYQHRSRKPHAGWVLGRVKP
jgi:hypothetical protein